MTTIEDLKKEIELRLENIKNKPFSVGRPYEDAWSMKIYQALLLYIDDGKSWFPKGSND